MLVCNNNIICCLEWQTPFDIAHYRGCDKVVQVFQCHGIQVDVQDKVSDISLFMLNYINIDTYMY